MPRDVLRQIDQEMKDLQKEVEEFHKGQDPIAAALADFQAMQEEFRKESTMSGSWDEKSFPQPAGQSPPPLKR